MPSLEATESTTRVVLKRTEYDVYTNRELESELRRLSGPQCIVDLRNVRYLDCTSLAALVRALKRLRMFDAGATLTIQGLSANLRKIFELTRLTELFCVLA